MPHLDGAGLAVDQAVGALEQLSRRVTGLGDERWRLLVADVLQEMVAECFVVTAAAAARARRSLMWRRAAERGGASRAVACQDLRAGLQRGCGSPAGWALLEQPPLVLPRPDGLGAVWRLREADAAQAVRAAPDGLLTLLDLPERGELLTEAFLRLWEPGGGSPLADPGAAYLAALGVVAGPDGDAGRLGPRQPVLPAEAAS